MRVPSCCRAFDDPQTCEHKQRYIDAEAYIRSQGYYIRHAPSGAQEDAWKGGRSFVQGKSMDIWLTAYEYYGWDGLTSVLIHEFGRCKLYEAEAIFKGLAAERKANDYVARSMLPELVPPNYAEHRAFKLQSYEDPPAFATKEQVLQAFELWNE